MSFDHYPVPVPRQLRERGAATSQPASKGPRYTLGERVGMVVGVLAAVFVVVLLIVEKGSPLQ
jgi:hypothetical protein